MLNRDPSPPPSFVPEPPKVRFPSFLPKALHIHFLVITIQCFQTNNETLVLVLQECDKSSLPVTGTGSNAHRFCKEF